MYKIIDVNGSKICYEPFPSMWTAEYYNYCIDLLIKTLASCPNKINIIFGNIEYLFKNDNKTIKIDIQTEHTLVKPGGRSVDELIFGSVDLLDEDGKYLIRIVERNYFSRLDVIIDYSMANIFNASTNSICNEYSKRVTYIAPMLYDLNNFNNQNRQYTITIGNSSDRRTVLNSKINGLVNIQNVLDKEKLKDIYKQTKIMINIHQTDHHHTLEELRILPALCNGVIIVSEDVPLKDVIPYSDSIIWGSYADIPDIVKDVEDNYDYCHERIFTTKLTSILQQLRCDNLKKMKSLIDTLAKH